MPINFFSLKSFTLSNMVDISLALETSFGFEWIFIDFSPTTAPSSRSKSVKNFFMAKCKFLPRSSAPLM